MNRRNSISILLGLVMMTALSCTRDHLYYEARSRNQVQLNIDWSRTAFSSSSRSSDTDNRLNGVTIFAFDSATHRLVAELPPFANWQSPRVSLEPGTYHLIVINDSRAELPAIHFDTEQRFEDFSAFIDVDTVYKEHPDYLTVSSLRNVRFEPSAKEYF